MAIAFELAEMGARMVEARYRREHPDADADADAGADADDAEVAAHVRAWWLDRPGAPHGDRPVRRTPTILPHCRRSRTTPIGSQRCELPTIVAAVATDTAPS